jgi:DNA modification methylase
MKPCRCEHCGHAFEAEPVGGHRLLCGDSTKAEDVERLLDGARPLLMVADPPYGVAYDADWRNHTGDLGRTARAVGKVVNDDRADWREAWALFPGDVAYVWHGGIKAHIVAESLLACGFDLVAQIVWAKNQLVIGRGNYHPQHEPCWYAVRRGKARRFTDDRTQTTLWAIPKPRKSETGHSTQKPVECIARPMRNHRFSEVYDPFLGSGTTLIAAEQLGRRCFALEIAGAYCDLSVRRWEAFTGRRATRCPN